MTPILASATVERTWHRSPTWRVTVVPFPCKDVWRVYIIEANDDTDAAQQGLLRFVEEMGGDEETFQWL